MRASLLAMATTTLLRGARCAGKITPAPIPNPVHGLYVQLLLGLDMHKVHVLFGPGLGDGFRR